MKTIDVKQQALCTSSHHTKAQSACHYGRIREAIIPLHHFPTKRSDDV